VGRLQELTVIQCHDCWSHPTEDNQRVYQCGQPDKYAAPSFHFWTSADTVVGDLVQVCLWSVIEVDVGVICPCLPSFRLILRRLIPRIAGTTGAYEMGTGPTGQSGTFDKSAVRKGGAADGNGIMVVREVVVTPDAKEEPSNDGASTDGRSCASATELVFPGGLKR